MAIIPTQKEPSVQETATPGVMSTADDFGAVQARQGSQLGNTVSQSGSLLSDVAAREQDRENITMVQSATAAYESKMNEFKREADKRRGYQAKGLTAEADDFSNKQIEEQLKSIDNDVAKQAFRVKAMSSHRKKLSVFAGFEDSNLERAQLDAHHASTKSAIDGAIAYHNDSDVVSGNKRTISNNIDVEALQYGYDDATKKQKKQDAYNLLHKGVIGAKLADGDYAGAEEYFKKNKKEIDGSTLINVENSLKSHSVKKRAQEETDELVVKGLSETDALSQARAIDDPDVRDQVVTRIKQRFSEKKQAETEQYNSNLEALSKHIVGGGSWDEIPPEAKTMLKSDDYSKLKKLAQTGSEPETDWVAWTVVQEKMVSDPKWVKDNYASLLLKLGPTEQSKLRTFVDKGLDGAQFSVIQTKNQIFKSVQNVLGIEKNDVKVSELAQRFDSEIEAIESETGKKATNKDIQKIADRMLIDVTKERDVLWDTSFKVGDVEAIKDNLPQIPPDIVDELAYDIQRKGQPVTVDNISQYYTALKKRGVVQ